MHVTLAHTVEHCCGQLQNTDRTVLRTIHSAPEKPEFTYLYDTKSTILQTLSCPFNVNIAEVMPSGRESHYEKFGDTFLTYM